MLPKDETGASQVAYYWEDGILMCKWALSAEEDSGCNTIYQIVVPVGYRAQILGLDHDNVNASRDKQNLLLPIEAFLLAWLEK